MENIMDHIRCNNCGFIGYVKTGSDACPICKEETLSWFSENTEEHEVEISEQNSDILKDWHNWFIDQN